MIMMMIMVMMVMIVLLMAVKKMMVQKMVDDWPTTRGGSTWRWRVTDSSPTLYQSIGCSSHHHSHPPKHLCHCYFHLRCETKKEKSRESEAKKHLIPGRAPILSGISALSLGDQEHVCHRVHSWRVGNLKIQQWEGWSERGERWQGGGWQGGGWQGGGWRGKYRLKQIAVDVEPGEGGRRHWLDSAGQSSGLTLFTRHC